MKKLVPLLGIILLFVLSGCQKEQVTDPETSTSTQTMIVGAKDWWLKQSLAATGQVGGFIALTPFSVIPDWENARVIESSVIGDAVVLPFLWHGKPIADGCYANLVIYQEHGSYKARITMLISDLDSRYVYGFKEFSGRGLHIDENGNPFGHFNVTNGVASSLMNEDALEFRNGCEQLWYQFVAATFTGTLQDIMGAAQAYSNCLSPGGGGGGVNTSWGTFPGITFNPPTNNTNIEDALLNPPPPGNGSGNYGGTPPPDGCIICDYYNP